MKVPFVDLARTQNAIRHELNRAVQSVIDDAAFIGTRSNAYVSSFEAEWAATLGVAHAIGCANGSDALEMTLTAMGIGQGDEVIVPAMTWISTASAVVRVGARPVFVDTDPGSYTLDATRVEDAVTDRTKALIPVHLYGLMADMAELMKVANRHGLYVIEDAAQAHGASRDGRTAGTWGHAATFSFFPSKNLGAFGDAGCVVTNDDGLAEEIRLLTNHGQRAKHDFVRLGRNSRMDGIQAAVLQAKLPYLDSWSRARRDVAAAYLSEMVGSAQLSLPLAPMGAFHVYHLFVVIAHDRPAFVRTLREAGIAVSHHYPTKLWEVPALSVGKVTNDYPVAMSLAENGVSLPMFAGLSEDEVSRVVESVNVATEAENLSR